MNNSRNVRASVLYRRFLPLFVGLFLPALSHAQAGPVTWHLDNVTFNTGATASGSFRYDASTNTYSEIAVTVADSPLNGTNTYGLINPHQGSNGFAMNTVVEVLPDMSNVKHLKLLFTTQLTAAGGTIDIIPGTSSYQSGCHAICSGHPGPFDDVVTGSVTTGPIPSSETVRLGTPNNPAALLPGQTSGPVIGQTWDPIIDHSSFFPGADSDLIAVNPDGVQMNIASGLGTVLCNVPNPTLIFISSPAGTAFSIAVPDMFELVGLSLCTQGGSFTANEIQLTNALDLVIGEM